MTARKPLVSLAGKVQQLPVGDRLLGLGTTTFAIAPPASPVAGDKWVDTSDPGVLVEYTWLSDADGGQWVELGSGGLSPDVAALTHASTTKTAPVDADELPIIDSGTGFSLKRLTWAALKSALFTSGVAIGDQAPTLKMKVVTVTAPSSTGSLTVAHGLNRSNIRMIVATVNGVTYNVGADYATNTALAFAAYTTGVDCCVYVSSTATEVFGRPVYFTILYTP